MKTGSGGEGKTKEKPLVNTVATKRQEPPKSSTASPAPRKAKQLPSKSSEVAPEWDLAKALQLRFTGVSHGDIAKYFGIPKSTLQARIKPFCGHNDEVQAYKSHRADILTAQQARVLAALTDADLKKASARDKATVFGILFDKERLERGQSTSNQSVFFHIVQESDEAD